MCLQDLTPLLADIVMEVLGNEADLEVVRAEPGPLDRVIEGLSLDVLVVGLPEKCDVEGWEGLLLEHPRFRLLGLADDGKAGWIYELRPHREALGSVSPVELIAAVRGSGAGD